MAIKKNINSEKNGGNEILLCPLCDVFDICMGRVKGILNELFFFISILHMLCNVLFGIIPGCTESYTNFCCLNYFQNF